MKGITIGQFGALALTFVILTVSLSIFGSTLTGVGQALCPSGSSWVDGFTQSVNEAPMPEAGYTGCCTAQNTTGDPAQTLNCTTWYSSVSLNNSYSGVAGIGSMGDWLGTIAIVIAAAVVLGVIIHNFR